MPTVNPLSEVTRSTVDAAARLTQISLDSAERTLAIQLEFAKAAVAQGSITAKAVAEVRDVQQLFTLLARGLEGFVEAMLQLLKLAICLLNKLPCLIEDTGSVLHLALLIN